MKAEMGPREMAPSSATAFAKGHEFTRAARHGPKYFKPLSSRERVVPPCGTG